MNYLIDYLNESVGKFPTNLLTDLIIEQLSKFMKDGEFKNKEFSFTIVFTSGMSTDEANIIKRRGKEIRKGVYIINKIYKSKKANNRAIAIIGKPLEKKINARIKESILVLNTNVKFNRVDLIKTLSHELRHLKDIINDLYITKLPYTDEDEEYITHPVEVRARKEN